VCVLQAEAKVEKKIEVKAEKPAFQQQIEALVAAKKAQIDAPVQVRPRILREGSEWGCCCCTACCSAVGCSSSGFDSGFQPYVVRWPVCQCAVVLDGNAPGLRGPD
jgi:hypothetical protein